MYREGDIIFSIRRENECDYVTTVIHLNGVYTDRLASVLTSPSAWICKDRQDVSEMCIQNKKISPLENLVLRKIYFNISGSVILKT